MKLAVTNVAFMCDGKWFVQVDGVAMGSALAVILSNIWLKSFESKISRDNPPIPNADDVYPCGECGNTVSDNDCAVCCDSCEVWFHAECKNLSPDDIIKLRDKQWHCGCTNVKTDYNI